MDSDFKKDLKELSTKLVIKNRATDSRDKFDFLSYPLIHNQAIYVLAMKSGKVVYQRNILDMLGYHEQEFSFDSPFTLIHKDDYPIVKKVVKATLEYSSRYGMSDDAVLYLTYRIRKKDGSYLKIQRTSGVCSINKDQTLNGHYSVIQDISYMGLAGAVRWHWHNPAGNEELYRKHLRITPIDFFTKKEMEVFELLKQGLDGKSIAEKLNITYNTLKSHRKKMVQKAGVKNTFELLQFFEQGSLHDRG